MKRLNHDKRKVFAALTAAFVLLLSTLLPAAYSIYAVWTGYFVQGYYKYSPVATTPQEIEDIFPETYWSDIKAIMEKHPTWKFQALYTGLDWEQCFTDAAEMYPTRNLAQNISTGAYGICKAWYSSREYSNFQSFNWAANTWNGTSGGNWFQASEEAVRYCMDPRNFLNDKNVFMFLSCAGKMGETVEESTEIIQKIFTNKGIAYWNQSRETANIYVDEEVRNPEYDAYLELKAEKEAQESSIAEELEKNPEFEAPEITVTLPEEIPPETIEVRTYMTYAEALGRICQQLGMNEAQVANRLITEQGNGTSSLISGTTAFAVTSRSSYDVGKIIYGGYYQYFNLGASGTTQEDVRNNGLTEAYIRGWDTRYKSLLGGAEQYFKLYIENGQTTSYTMKFNVLGGTRRLFWGQYMQAVHAPISDSVLLYNTYTANDILESAATFVIPVFRNMPTQVSPIPVGNANPNHKLGSIYVNEESIFDFHMDKCNYGEFDFPYSKDQTALNIMAYAPEATVKAWVYHGSEEIEIELTKTVDAYGGVAHGYYSGYMPIIPGKNRVLIHCFAENGQIRGYDFFLNMEAAPPEETTEEETTVEETTVEETEESTQESTSEDEFDPENPAGGFAIGDVNGDTSIDVVDMAEIRSHILKYKVLKGAAFYRGDVDSSNELDVVDMAFIRSYILGFITELTK